MIKKFRNKDATVAAPSGSDDLFAPRMPEVSGDSPEKALERARRAALGELVPLDTPRDQKHVVIVTPDRRLMLKPAPAAGQMPENKIQALQTMLPSNRQRMIAAIAYTDMEAIETDISKAIPFFGLLIGLAYIGHVVWVFEGDARALRPGTAGADILIVDQAMIPYLDPDWQRLVAGVMRRPDLFMHDREHYILRRIKVDRPKKHQQESTPEQPLSPDDAE